MRGKLRIWYRQRVTWFLGRFKEVQQLRKLENTTISRIREATASELEQRKLAEQAKIDRNRIMRELEETKKALEIMTEARLNGERALEVVRGQMDMVQNEVLSIKQMTDWFALESRRRPVFGVAPVQPTAPENVEPVGTRIRARGVVREETAKFYEQAQALYDKGEPLPNTGPEYSSTSHAQNPA